MYIDLSAPVSVMPVCNMLVYRWGYTLPMHQVTFCRPAFMACMCKGDSKRLFDPVKFLPPCHIFCRQPLPSLQYNVYVPTLSWKEVTVTMH